MDGAPAMACRGIFARVGLTASAVLLSLSPHAARAQDRGAAYLMSPQPVTQLGGIPDSSPTDHTLVVGGWILSPEILAGMISNDNVRQASVNTQAAFGVRVRPSITAVRDAGIHKTTIDAQGDLQFYNTGGSSNILNGGLGLIHVYEAQRDLVFRLEGRANRTNDIFSNSQAGPGAGISQTTLTYLASASVQKNFSNLFVGLGAAALRTTYSGGVNTGQDSNQYTVSSRVGYRVGPVFYAFVDPSYNWRAYDAININSNGYRVVAGVGSERVGLFAGEVFAGYAAQRYSSALVAEAGGGVFGGRVSWFPTRDITVTAQAESKQTDSATLPAPGVPAITSSRTTTASLNAQYKLVDYWTFASRLAYSHTRYNGSVRADDRWVAAASVNYSFWRHWSLTAEYQFSRINSNVTGFSFAQNLITVGAVYRY